jgi:ATP-binding cassette, subfamily C (CFTR/MRP), member 1
VLIGIQTAILVGWLHHFKSTLSQQDLTTGILGIVSAVAVLLLETFEHSRIAQPSPLVSVFLLVTAVLDSVELVKTTPRLLLCGADLITRVLLLILESWPKTAYLKDASSYSPEETTGIIGKWLFWWINPVLFQGYRRTITEKDVFQMDQNMKSRYLEEEFVKIWSYCKCIIMLRDPAELDRQTKKARLPTFSILVAEMDLSLCYTSQAGTDGYAIWPSSFD